MSVAGLSNADVKAGTGAFTSAPNTGNNVSANLNRARTVPSKTNSPTDLGVVFSFLIDVGIAVERISYAGWSEIRGYLPGRLNSKFDFMFTSCYKASPHCGFTCSSFLFVYVLVCRSFFRYPLWSRPC